MFLFLLNRRANDELKIYIIISFHVCKTLNLIFSFSQLYFFFILLFFALQRLVKVFFYIFFSIQTNAKTVLYLKENKWVLFPKSFLSIFALSYFIFCWFNWAPHWFFYVLFCFFAFLCKIIHEKINERLKSPWYKNGIMYNSGLIIS